MKSMIHGREILAHELIGRNAEIRANGKIFEGKIVNETKNTIEIDTGGRTAMLQKGISEISISLGNGKKAVFSGNDIAYRPWERVKRLLGKKAKVVG